MSEQNELNQTRNLKVRVRDVEFVPAPHQRIEVARTRENLCAAACAGVSDSDLRALSYAELRRQRDKLAEALENLERVAGIAAPHDDPARVAAREALSLTHPKGK